MQPNDVDRARRQLYILSASTFRSPNYVASDGEIVTQSADSVPLMRWPNGSWCHPANAFIRALYERGLSRRNKGGSLSIAACNISHLLRYCWSHRLDLVDLDDNDF